MPPREKRMSSESGGGGHVYGARRECVLLRTRDPGGRVTAQQRCVSIIYSNELRHCIWCLVDIWMQPVTGNQQISIKVSGTRASLLAYASNTMARRGGLGVKSSLPKRYARASSDEDGGKHRRRSDKDLQARSVQGAASMFPSGTCL